MLKHEWQRAYARVKEALKIAINRTRIASAETDKTRASIAPSEIAQAAANLQLLIKSAHQIATADPSRAADLARDTFPYAQWRMGSEAADALAEMAGRVAVNPTLTTVIRERQDLEAEWHRIDHVLEADLNKLANQRDVNAEQSLLKESVAIEAKLTGIDKRLGKDFEKYVAIARIEPLTVEQTQALLNPDEALILLLPTSVERLPTGVELPIPEETFIWVITKENTSWANSALGTKALAEQAATLRCGLDRAGNWEFMKSAKRWQSTNETCKSLRPIGLAEDELLPFDLRKAYALYKALFGEVEPLIAGKSLLVVPFGALTQLPFHVLLTAQAEPKENLLQTLRNARWLGRSHAITVLPAVSSLKLLRDHPRLSQAKRPFIGIGNPLLEGDPKDEQQRKDAELAKKWQNCVFRLPDAIVATSEPTHRSPGVRDVRGLADRDSILRNASLPETANELCAVAEGLKADRSEVLLGKLATETEIKRRNANNELANYRVVHFATHAAVAGDFRGTREPGLLLTPPKRPSEEDDGYLSASEIASLKLDADWVILSACNTAAGGAESAEALSGLARAFFYAGARALLVSHWSVNSYASETLVTETQSALLADPKVGRAEALRRVMLHVIETAETPEQMHPAYWAPFFVVGEGGAGR
jgi:CHAT domain-containing protein